MITTFLRSASNAFDFPEDIATGSDGNLWYTSHNTDEIVRFNPNTPVFTGFTDPSREHGRSDQHHRRPEW